MSAFPVGVAIIRFLDFFFHHSTAQVAEINISNPTTPSNVALMITLKCLFDSGVAGWVGWESTLENGTRTTPGCATRQMMSTIIWALPWSEAEQF
jgi:hypothetical protein